MPAKGGAAPAPLALDAMPTPAASSSSGPRGALSGVNVYKWAGISGPSAWARAPASAQQQGRTPGQNLSVLKSKVLVSGMYRPTQLPRDATFVAARKTAHGPPVVQRGARAQARAQRRHVHRRRAAPFSPFRSFQVGPVLESEFSMRTPLRSKHESMYSTCARRPGRGALSAPARGAAALLPAATLRHWHGLRTSSVPGRMHSCAVYVKPLLCAGAEEPL